MDEIELPIFCGTESLDDGSWWDNLQGLKLLWLKLKRSWGKLRRVGGKFYKLVEKGCCKEAMIATPVHAIISL